MKLVINYDFFEEIRNAREPYTPLKIIRNNKIPLAFFHFPVCMAINLMNNELLEALKVYGFDFIFATGTLFLLDMIRGGKIGADPYANDAKERLKDLANDLRSINVKTNYNLLLESEHYKTNHKLQVNNSKIPLILESKFVLMPTEEYKTFILQEHIVGTKEYVLSKGTPNYKLRLADAKI